MNVNITGLTDGSGPFVAEIRKTSEADSVILVALEKERERGEEVSVTIDGLEYLARVCDGNIVSGEVLGVSICFKPKLKGDVKSQPPL